MWGVAVGLVAAAVPVLGDCPNCWRLAKVALRQREGTPRTGFMPIFEREIPNSVVLKERSHLVSKLRPISGGVTFVEAVYNAPGVGRVVAEEDIQTIPLSSVDDIVFLGWEKLSGHDVLPAVPRSSLMRIIMKGKGMVERVKGRRSETLFICGAARTSAREFKWLVHHALPVRQWMVPLVKELEDAAWDAIQKRPDSLVSLQSGLKSAAAVLERFQRDVQAPPLGHFNALGKALALRYADLRGRYAMASAGKPTDPRVEEFLGTLQQIQARRAGVEAMVDALIQPVKAELGDPALGKLYRDATETFEISRIESSPR